MDLFKEIEREVDQLREAGRQAVAIAMSFQHFKSEEVAASFIRHDWEVPYANALLHPAEPLSLCGLPLCFNYGAVPEGFTWGIASKSKEG